MCQVLMLFHLLRLSSVGEAIRRYCLVHCYIKLMSVKRTGYRFKTNFDGKTAFTTKRGYIEKLSSLKLKLNKYR